jgi:hypothetical protein
LWLFRFWELFCQLGIFFTPFDVGWLQFVGLVDEGLKAGDRQPSIESVEARRYQSIEVVAGPHLIGDRKPLAAVANVPRNDQLGVGINAGPSPNVASRLLGALGELNVLLLGVAERPNFVALRGLGGHIADHCVVEGRASVAASIRSFETVLMETLVIRETERMDDPSQSMDRI